MRIRTFFLMAAGFLVPVIGFSSLYATDSTLFAGQYLAADYASRHHDAPGSAQLFRRMADQEPNNLVLLNQSYRSFLSAGDIHHAEMYANKALLLNPGDNLAYLLITLQAFREQHFSEARKRLQARIPLQMQGAELSPDGGIEGIEPIVFPYLLLWAKAGEGNYPEAILDAEAMLEKGSDNDPFIYYQIALLADLAGDIRKAAHFFEKGLATSYHSYAYIKAAGNFFERQGNSKRAREIYQLYQAEHPYMGYFSSDIARTAGRGEVPKRAIQDATAGAVEVLAEIGKVLFNAGLYLPSLGYLQMVRGFVPDHHDAIILLGAYYGESEQYNKIIDLYRPIRPDSDLYQPGRMYWAEHLYRKGQKKRAVRQLIAISKYRTVHHLALITLADLLRKDHRCGDASSIYDEIIRHIAHVKPEDWVLFFSRGICYENTNQWEKSKNDFHAALTLQPDQPEVLNYLGYGMVERGLNMEDARAMIKKALDQRPEDAQIMDSMGWVLYKLHEYDEAVTYFEKALEFSPKDAVINDHLGDIYWHQGRKSEARFQWRKALKYKGEKDMVDIPYLKCKLKEGISCMR